MPSIAQVIAGAQQIAASGGAFEPQRQANWFIQIVGLTGGAAAEDILAFSLESGFLPNESNEEIEIQYANERRYVAGKALFETGSLVVKDFVDKGTADTVVKWRKTVYDQATGKVGLAKEYKKNASIVLFGPEGSFKREWRLEGVWPQAVNYGTLDMTANDKVTIEITLRYDKAVPVIMTASAAS